MKPTKEFYFKLIVHTTKKGGVLNINEKGSHSDGESKKE
jgi:hypothetical protein